MSKDFGTIDFSMLLEQITNDIMDVIKGLPEEEQEAMLSKWKRVREKREDDSQESVGELWRTFTNDSGKCILTGCNAGGENIVLPDMINGLTFEIGNHAFQNSKIESITISGGVTTVGRLAFAHCNNLKKVTFDDGFSGIIMNSAFFDCGSLGEFIFPPCTSVIEPIVQRCQNLASIYIPNSVTTITSYAFAENINLKNIYFNGTKSEWSAIKKGYRWSDGMGDYIVYCQDGKIVTNKKTRKIDPAPKSSKCIVETQISLEEENTEYIYCEVDLGALRKYSYITEDESIKEGDTVVVPIGSRNLETMGVVVNVIRCTGKHAPYPPSKTKKIIRKYNA